MNGPSCLISNVTELFVIRCVMIMADERCQSKIARSAPLCDWSCRNNLIVQRRNSLPILAKCNHFNTTWLEVYVNFWFRWSSKQRLDIMKLATRHVRQFAIELSVTFHVVGPGCDVFVGFSSVLTSALALISFENHFCFSITNSDIVCAGCWNTSKIFLISEWHWVMRNDFILQCCPHLRHVLSCALFMASAYNDGNICNLGWKFVHSYPESSPILLQSGIFSHFLSQKSPANERPKRFRSRDTAGSSSESLCCVLLAFGVLTQMIGQSSSERWRCSGASFILTCVYALKASLACPEQLGNLEITS